MTDIVLTVRRVIAASPARLFEAWTTPAALRQWFGPKDVRCIAAEVDLRVGGAYKLGNQLPDGHVVWITGTFEVIEPPRRLVYSWQIGDEPPSRVTVTFEPAGAATEVVVVHERARDGAEGGWLGCLDGLERWSGPANG